MDQLQQMTKEVVEWVQRLLPDEMRDPVNTSIKLSEEASELTHALYTGDGSVGEECADVLVLLLDICHLKGINLEEEFYAKMGRNKKRRWNLKKGALCHEP